MCTNNTSYYHHDYNHCYCWIKHHRCRSRCARFQFIPLKLKFICLSSPPNTSSDCFAQRVHIKKFHWKMMCGKIAYKWSKCKYLHKMMNIQWILPWFVRTSHCELIQRVSFITGSPTNKQTGTHRPTHSRVHSYWTFSRLYVCNELSASYHHHHHHRSGSGNCCIW